MIGEAIKALSKLEEPALAVLKVLELPELQALAEWLDGGEIEPGSLALVKLPDVLKSELALARAEARAKAGGG